MTVQILRKKFTVGQYHQMIESGILSDRDQTSGRCRVALPRVTAQGNTPHRLPIPANIQPTMLIDDKHPALGEEISPLRR
ncbi:hypothetical protein [Almyronema epifaneia]|uniref:Uncharacterized protein n=1 Tax=Almyronema epifaneia S1 TaxID=2991925 RepID=A0ABW6IBL1_9CYAN